MKPKTDKEVVALYQDVVTSRKDNRRAFLELTVNGVQRLIDIARRALEVDAKVAENVEIQRLNAEVQRFMRTCMELDQARSAAWSEGYQVAMKHIRKDEKDALLAQARDIIEKGL